MTKCVKRICLACRQLKNREELIKITKVHDTQALVVDPDSNTFGRSAYICKNEYCMGVALKKNKIEKSLKAPLSEDIRDYLKSSVRVI